MIMVMMMTMVSDYDEDDDQEQLNNDKDDGNDDADKWMTTVMIVACSCFYKDVRTGSVDCVGYLLDTGNNGVLKLRELTVHSDTSIKRSTSI